MAINLLRFLAWQTPLLLPLALIGLFRCRERSGTLVGLALGIALTLLVVLVVMPFQGHGWGYRYLHGMLGSMALLAAQGWIWLSNVAPDLRKQLACVLGLSIALSVLALLPWRLAQVYAFVRPPAAASAAIARSNSDVVIVDATNIWYGVDLVRNDPLLRSQPKVLDLASLRAEQVKVICGRYRVAIFDTEDAARTGLRLGPSLSPSAAGNARRLRDLLQNFRLRARARDGRQRAAILTLGAVVGGPPHQHFEPVRKKVSQQAASVILLLPGGNAKSSHIRHRQPLLLRSISRRHHAAERDVADQVQACQAYVVERADGQMILDIDDAALGNPATFLQQCHTRCRGHMVQHVAQQ